MGNPEPRNLHKRFWPPRAEFRIRIQNSFYFNTQTLIYFLYRWIEYWSGWSINTETRIAPHPETKSRSDLDLVFRRVGSGSGYYLELYPTESGLALGIRAPSIKTSFADPDPHISLDKKPTQKWRFEEDKNIINTNLHEVLSNFVKRLCIYKSVNILLDKQYFGIFRI